MAPDLSAASSLVVVKPSSLGDVVHALPTIHYIKRAHPHLDIRWIVNTEWAPLLADNPDLSSTILFPRRQMRGLRGIPTSLRFRRLLKKLAPVDLVLDLQGLLRSALISRQLKPRHLAGMSDAREGATNFYDPCITVDPAAHAVDRYLTTATALGVPTDPEHLAFPLPKGSPSPEFAPLDSTYVVLHPFSRGQGKSLSHPHIRHFCNSLAPATVVLAGVTTSAVTDLPTNTVDATNKTTLSGLVHLLRNSAYTVSVDSGPMHIAAALNPRLLGIHTWTDPRKVGPYTPGTVAWKSGRIAPRNDFSAGECQADSTLANGDIDTITNHVKAVLDD